MGEEPLRAQQFGSRLDVGGFVAGPLYLWCKADELGETPDDVDVW